MIKSILVYSKVGKNDAPLQKIKLKEVLELKLHDLSQKIKERNVKLEIDELPEIFCVKDQMGMLFHNLVNNAIKFNDKDQPNVKVHHHTDAQDGFWQFSVTDNGIGISPEYKDKVFELFKRIHTRHEFEGTGIGLAVCLKIIQQHNGKIWIESIPGEGTSFFFTISKNLKNEISSSEENRKQLKMEMEN